MKLTEAEWKVMNVAWEATEPPAPKGVTAREVLDAVEDETDWAYTTTKTVMARLVEKRALRMEMRGNTSVYTPAITREEARRTEVRGLVDRAFEGTLVPLMHFLLSRENLSNKEKQELRNMLAEEDGDPGAM
jgi:BlaI family transcriptional regulator, penicillinase repressor